MANYFAAHTVFLCGEGKGGKSGALDVLKGGSGRWHPGVANKELDVTEAKGLGVRGSAVFTRAKKPEKGKVGQVGDGKVRCVARDHCLPTNMVKELDREWFDT
jgi:hypothetical protein